MTKAILEPEKGTADPSFTKVIYFKCNRNPSGGPKAYEHKTDRHLTSKATSRKASGPCPCQLTVKTYPDVAIVLGFFEQAHNHELVGRAHRLTLRLSRSIRQEAVALMQIGVPTKDIVSFLFL